MYLPRAHPAIAGAANTLQIILLALVATALPVLAHTVGGVPLGAAFAVGLALLIAAGAPAAIPIVILFSFVFQNFVVATISPHLADLQDFTMVRSYNFILVATFWCVVTYSYFIGRARLEGLVDRVLRYSYGLFALIGVYFMIGAIQDPNGAAIYLRNVATPLMCLQIGLFIGARSRPSFLGGLAIIAVVALVYGYVELIFTMDFLRQFNGDTYIALQMAGSYKSEWVQRMQETGYVVRGLEDTMKTTPFNYFSDLNITVFRLLGPNLHPISFAYSLAFFSIVLIAIRRGAIYLLLALPILVVVGSKGAMAYLLITVPALLVARYYRGNALFAAFVLAVALYASVTLVVALQEGNYHALGFVGGLKQFVVAPWGHGLGIGGNLAAEQVDWGKAQQLGYTDEARESAVAVLLFQMGVAGFVVLAFICWIAWRCWVEFHRTGQALLAAASFGLLVMTINGILQEEALFSPLALAVLLLLAGLELARAAEPQVARAVAPRSARGQRAEIARGPSLR